MRETQSEREHPQRSCAPGRVNEDRPVELPAREVRDAGDVLEPLPAGS